MQILIAPTENFILTTKTAFSADLASGQTDVLVDNAQDFVADDYIVLGAVGYDTAELAQVDHVNSNTVTIKNVTNNSHVVGEVITKIIYNQRKFYRATSETGSYVHLAADGSPKDIQVDNAEGTYFEDPNGTKTSWYKSTYYNATTFTESDLDDAIATMSGESEFYTSIYKIKSEAGFQNNQYIQDADIDSYRVEAQSEVDSMLSALYEVPFINTPKIIEHITRILAAGLLLQKEYGMEANVEIAKTGERKIERAEKLIDKIFNKEMRLVDSTGALLAIAQGVIPSQSNVYDGLRADKGTMFDLRDEHFRMRDPKYPK